MLSRLTGCSAGSHLRFKCRRIGGWEVYLSADGTTFPATPKKAGTWANTLATKTVTFAAERAKAIRLKAVSPAEAGQPWASAGEINVQGTAVSGGGTLPRTGWSIRADSSETDTPIANFIDGNANTFWHTGWRTTAPPLPHTVTVTFSSTATVSGFTYLPRQDGVANGRIGAFDVRCSLLCMLS